MPILFVALRPPPAVRALLASAMAGIDGARWQSDERLHLTVRYIGEVDHATAEDVALALSEVRAGPFDLSLTGIGQFETRGRPNVLWIGATPREPLAALHRKVDAAVIRAGLAPEGRAYLPHITLARMGAGSSQSSSAWIGDHSALCTPTFRADAMILFESIRGSAGSHYEAVARFPLA